TATASTTAIASASSASSGRATTPTATATTPTPGRLCWRRSTACRAMSASSSSPATPSACTASVADRLRSATDGTPPMSENLRWYTKALYGLDHVVRLAPSDAWDSPSPCDEWSARDVIGHVIAVQRYLEATIGGLDAPMNPMVDPGRHAGDDPAAAWAAARDAMLTALDRPGVLRSRITTHHGDEEVDRFVGSNVVDTTVHTWDLARSLGVDERLD